MRKCNSMQKGFGRVTALLLAWGVPCIAYAEAPREPVDDVIAIIDDSIMTRRELEAKAAPYLAQLDEIADPAVKQERRTMTLRQVLDIEIGEKMVEKELSANREKLAVTDKDVDKAVDEVMRMNHMDKTQLQAALVGQGMTWSEYRSKLRSQIERARLIQMKVQAKPISDEEAVRRCRERGSSQNSEAQVCASHILLKIPPNASAAQVEATRARAGQLQAELAAGGADFSAYTMKYSDDKGTPDGRLGCFGRGEMVEPFERAAFALKPGDLSQVVRTQFGFHIIKVTDRRAPPAADCNNEEVLQGFRAEIYQEEMDRQMSAWVQELRRKAFVDVRL